MKISDDLKISEHQLAEIKENEPKTPTALFERQREGDFSFSIRSSILAKETPSLPIAVIAPHGGWIEIGTSQLLHQIISELSVHWYELESHFWTGYDDHHARAGFPGSHPHHLPSTKFLEEGYEELQLAPILEAAALVITIHGCREMTAKGVMVGGGHSAARAIMVNTLKKHGIKILEARSGLHGTHTKNMVNRAESACMSPLSFPDDSVHIPPNTSLKGTGIQLELTRLLLNDVRSGKAPEVAQAIIEAITKINTII